MKLKLKNNDCCLVVRETEEPDHYCCYTVSTTAEHENLSDNEFLLSIVARRLFDDDFVNDLLEWNGRMKLN
jgi:hypothetical protein